LKFRSVRLLSADPGGRWVRVYEYLVRGLWVLASSLGANQAAPVQEGASVSAWLAAVALRAAGQIAPSSSSSCIGSSFCGGVGALLFGYVKVSPPQRLICIKNFSAFAAGATSGPVSAAARNSFAASMRWRGELPSSVMIVSKTSGARTAKFCAFSRVARP